MKILIAEDQEMLADEMRRKLNVLLTAFPDAEVSMVGTFAKALAAVQAYPAPDIILLDLSFPDSQWEATVARAHEIDERSATIIVTGHSAEKVRALLQNKEIEIVEKTPTLLTSNILIEACVRALTRRQRRQSEKMRDNIQRMHELIGHAPAE